MSGCVAVAGSKTNSLELVEHAGIGEHICKQHLSEMICHRHISAIRIFAVFIWKLADTELTEYGATNHAVEHTRIVQFPVPEQGSQNSICEAGPNIY